MEATLTDILSSYPAMEYINAARHLKLYIKEKDENSLEAARYYREALSAYRRYLDSKGYKMPKPLYPYMIADLADRES